MAFAYPVFLDLGNVPVLLVGGGVIALRKATALVEAGALVTVIGPEVLDELAAIARHVERRAYRTGDIAGHLLVITATDDPAVNAAVAVDAKADRVWVNSADDPANCSFILPAVARRGHVTVAVSTGGASPALASRLRTNIAETHLTPAVEAAAIDLAAQRAAIHAAGASTEDVDWSARLDAALATGTSLPASDR